MRQTSDKIISPQQPRSARLVDFPDCGRQPPDPIPKLRELREDVFFRTEYRYLHTLVSLTGRNIHKACELSGLSRSRLYTLLKKYQISPSLYGSCRQK